MPEQTTQQQPARQSPATNPGYQSPLERSLEAPFNQGGAGDGDKNPSELQTELVAAQLKDQQAKQAATLRQQGESQADREAQQPSQEPPPKQGDKQPAQQPEKPPVTQQTKSPDEDPDKSRLDLRPKSPARAADWDKIKGERDTFRQELEATRSELQQLKSRPAPNNEALEKQLSEYKEIVKGLAIERDPEFTAKYDRSKQAAISAAKFAAGSKGAQLGEILTSGDEDKLNEFLQSLTPAASARVNAALGRLYQLDVDRQLEMEQARANWDSRQSSLLADRETQTQAQRQKLESLFGNTLREFQKPVDQGGHALYQHDSDPAGVKESIDLARQALMGELSEQDQIRAAFIVGSAPRLYKILEDVSTERDQLRSELEKLRAVQPGDTGSPGTSRPPSRGQAGDPGYDADFRSAIEQAQRQDQQKVKWL